MFKTFGLFVGDSLRESSNWFTSWFLMMPRMSCIIVTYRITSTRHSNIWSFFSIRFSRYNRRKQNENGFVWNARIPKQICFCFCKLVQGTCLRPSNLVARLRRPSLMWFRTSRLSSEWRWWDSNSWPPACKAGALPTELHPHLVILSIYVFLLSSTLYR